MLYITILDRGAHWFLQIGLFYLLLLFLFLIYNYGTSTNISNLISSNNFLHRRYLTFPFRRNTNFNLCSFNISKSSFIYHETINNNTLQPKLVWSHLGQWFHNNLKNFSLGVLPKYPLHVISKLDNIQINFWITN